MRTVQLLPTLALLPGCIFELHPHHGRPDDTAAVVDTGSSAETGDVPATCDERVRRALDDLVHAPFTGCGHATVTAAVAARDGEVALQLFADTLDGADRPTAPYVVGTTYTFDLATAPPQQAFARLLLGGGQLASACNDVPVDDAFVEHTWLGVAGTLTIVVTGTGEVTDWGAASFEADVGVSGLIVDDGAGGTCAVPSIGFRHVHLGWLAG